MPQLYHPIEIKSTSQNVEVDNGDGLSQMQGDLKLEASGVLEADQEEKPNSLKPQLGLGDWVGVE